MKFARDNTRPTLGLKVGLYQAVHAVTPPTILGRTDTTGSVLLDNPGAVHLVLGVLVVAALASMVWRLRRRAPAAARLALVALVLLGAGLVNGSNVPRSFESERINLYRWTWAAAFVTWAALGIGAVYLLRVVRCDRRAAREPSRPARTDRAARRRRAHHDRHRVREWQATTTTGKCPSSRSKRASTPRCSPASIGASRCSSSPSARTRASRWPRP